MMQGLPPYNGLENLSWDVEDAIPTGIDDWANLPALDEAGAQLVRLTCGAARAGVPGADGHLERRGRRELSRLT